MKGSGLALVPLTPPLWKGTSRHGVRQTRLSGKTDPSIVRLRNKGSFRAAVTCAANFHPPGAGKFSRGSGEATRENGSYRRTLISFQHQHQLLNCRLGMEHGTVHLTPIPCVGEKVLLSGPTIETPTIPHRGGRWYVVVSQPYSTIAYTVFVLSCRCASLQQGTSREKADQHHQQWGWSINFHSIGNGWNSCPVRHVGVRKDNFTPHKTNAFPQPGVKHCNALCTVRRVTRKCEFMDCTYDLSCMLTD